MHPAVFLDRDNTLIANDGDLGDPTAVRLLDGVPDGLRSLRDAGYRLIVVTNQGGVARGRYSEQDVDAVHQRIARLVDEEAGEPHLIDRFYYCPYHPEATVDQYRREHPWRKPNPGMLLQAARDMELDLEASWLIGDQVRDVQAGRSAGCRTVLLRVGDQAPVPPAVAESISPTIESTTFDDAVRRILSQAPPKRGSEQGHAVDPAKGGSDPSSSSTSPVDSAASENRLHRAVVELTDELRTGRLRRGEFTPLRMAAAFCQLFVVLLALQGLLQLGDQALFVKWFAGAMLAQLVTLTLLVLDIK